MKIIWIWVGAMSPFLAHAVNPASVGYVDGQVQVLQNEINQLTLPTYEVGDYAQGGVVFWLDPSRMHGLTAAIVDQSASAAWDQDPTSLVGVFANGVWLGLPNTTFIVETFGPMGSDAATVCYNYGGGGYSDWYLPSAIEAALMIERKDFIDTTSMANGGDSISATTYWTSLEIDAMNAYKVDFMGRTISTAAKSGTLHVRAIRGF